MGRIALIFAIVTAPAFIRADEPEDAQAPAAQIEQLKRELAELRAENAALKEKLTAATRPTTQATTTRAATQATTRTSPDLPIATFELGPEAKLGNYTYRAPLDWAATPVKDSKLGMLYRSQDKAAVILVQVKPKGAAPLEMQQKFAQNVVQMLKQDFVKNKTEVVEPPAIQGDARFYCRVHERIKIKNEKTADQSHLYLGQGRDMVELTVITTSEASDQVASTVKLAEDVLLSFALTK
jgi:hypothetical protein